MLLLLPLISDSTNTFRGSIHETQYTHTYSNCSHGYHGLSTSSTIIPWSSTDLHSISEDVPTNVHEGVHGILHISVETYMQVRGRILAPMEIGIRVGERKFTITESSRSFRGSTRRFPLSVELETSIASINYSVHYYIQFKVPPWLPYTPTYYHLPASSSVTNFHLLQRWQP